MPTVRNLPTHLENRAFSMIRERLEGMTYASARSKLSFTTPVTFLIISKLSVASTNILCAATIADPSVTLLPGFPFSLSPSPFKMALDILGEEVQGDVALEFGEDLNPPSAPAPLSRCAALLCWPLLTEAPVPVAAAATVPPTPVVVPLSLPS